MIRDRAAKTRATLAKGATEEFTKVRAVVLAAFRNFMVEGHNAAALFAPRTRRVAGLVGTADAGAPDARRPRPSSKRPPRKQPRRKKVVYPSLPDAGMW